MEATICPVGVVWIGPRPLFCALEEGQHVVPTPARVAKFLPLVIILAVAPEVDHPVEHAAMSTI